MVDARRSNALDSTRVDSSLLARPRSGEWNDRRRGRFLARSRRPTHGASSVRARVEICESKPDGLGDHQWYVARMNFDDANGRVTRSTAILSGRGNRTMTPHVWSGMVMTTARGSGNIALWRCS